eukprot:CAMPEP_0198706480 /NCGR_PEP_ID=MMETSP1468-20131203/390989_1 /TAXON_ID=1461545 /ORGANISM="Mantoniella sp, Strain CCMP1436" /LENGTH=86 /DNA_ID=CAMNT_0044465427 /DNA_START=761 /DNA_END=1021 /DNA_ORIENTATION=+
MAYGDFREAFVPRTCQHTRVCLDDDILDGSQGIGRHYVGPCFAEHTQVIWLRHDVQRHPDAVDDVQTMFYITGPNGRVTVHGNIRR